MKKLFIVLAGVFFIILWAWGVFEAFHKRDFKAYAPKKSNPHYDLSPKKYKVLPLEIQKKLGPDAPKMISQYVFIRPSSPYFKDENWFKENYAYIDNLTLSEYDRAGTGIEPITFDDGKSWYVSDLFKHKTTGVYECIEKGWKKPWRGNEDRE